MSNQDRVRWLTAALATVALMVSVGLVAGLVAGLATVAEVRAAGAAGAAVAIRDFAFAPTSVTVTAGSVVTWTNAGGTSHTVTSDDGASFDSRPIAPGEAFASLFDRPGTYPYHCAIHPQMTGVVVVTAAAATPAASGSPERTPPPGTLPPSFPSTTAPPDATATATSEPAPSAPLEPASTGPGTGLIVGLGVLLVLVVAAGAYIRARRR